MPVDEVNNADLTGEVWKQRFDARRPMIIRGGAKRFPRFGAWDRTLVAQKCAELACTFSSAHRPVFAKATLDYAEFFATEAGHKYSFTRRKYIPEQRVLIEDFDPPNMYFGEDDVRFTILFAGPKDMGALPHRHGDALNFLAEGAKTWVMFDSMPGTPGVAYHDRYWELFGSDEATFQDWHSREIEALRADPTVTLHEFEQQAGDIVYIPAGYCHAVLNDADVLGIVVEIDRPGFAHPGAARRG